MATILLPSQIFEYSLLQLIQLLGSENDAEHIIVDFSHVNYYVPGAIVALITKFHRWHSEGKKVTARNIKQSPAYKYLQRIDFFSNCGIDLEEDFYRHPSAGRFVPVSRITYDTDSLATEIATCMEPILANSDDIEVTGPFDYFEYSISELGNNAIQHSKGTGFASAQYTPTSDYIRVAVADTGIGIKNSFSENASPHYLPDINDVGAIKIALTPEVSSKTHLHGWGSSPNAGVGLSLLWHTVHSLNGKFAIISGNGYLSTDTEHSLNDNESFKGTLCTFMFKRSMLKNFNELLNKTKIELGLAKNSNDFEDLFI